MKTYKYKNHTITQTSTTTDVYTLRFSRYVKEIRYMYAIDGEFWTGPKFTSIKEAKEWINERIRNNCRECGGLTYTIGFLGSNKVTYPCSKGC